MERETFGESKRVKVRVRNACGFLIPPEESWFEITAMPEKEERIVARRLADRGRDVHPLPEPEAVAAGGIIDHVGLHGFSPCRSGRLAG